jgi:hypothetical protein
MVAWMVTTPPGGGETGAVNSPADVIVPQAPAFVLGQLTLHTGETFRLSAVAVNVCCAPPASVTVVGEITKGGAVIVTVAVAFLVGSACAMAVMVIVPLGTGKILGAVYKPVVSIVPTLELPPVTPFTCHVTDLLLLERFTVAENWVV